MMVLQEQKPPCYCLCGNDADGYLLMWGDAKMDLCNRCRDEILDQQHEWEWHKYE